MALTIPNTRQLSDETLQALRLRAVRACMMGLSQTTVADAFGVARETVSRWWNAYRRGDYSGALGFVLKVNLSDHWPMHMFLIAIYGQLGDTAAASKAIRQLHRVRPDFAAAGRADVEKW